MFFKKRKQRKQREESVNEALNTDDPVLLSERQRLLQADAMDRWAMGMVDEKRRSRRWSTFFRMLILGVIILSLANTSILIYYASGKRIGGDKHIGIVDVEGVIDAGSKSSSDRIIEGIEKAAQNDSVTGIILRINSPGGSPAESHRVFEQIQYLGDFYDKPIVSWVGDIAASGAYYIAAGTDRIVASPSALTGSIGVINSGYGFPEAMERLGVERRVYEAGDNKAFLDPFQEVNVGQVKFMEGILETTHEQFKSDVIAGRNGKLDSEDDELFSGLIWTGQEAIDKGLVDSNATLDQLMREMSGQEGVPSTKNYTPGQNPFNQLSSIIPGVEAVASFLSSFATPGSSVRMEHIQ